MRPPISVADLGWFLFREFSMNDNIYNKITAINNYLWIKIYKLVF